jgi:hypothetical protein
MSIIINNLTELYNYLIQDDNLNNSNYIQLIYIYSGSNCILLKESLHFLIKLLAFISNKINNNYNNVDQVRIYLIEEIKKILLRINNCNLDPFIPFRPYTIQYTPLARARPFTPNIARPQPFTPATPQAFTPNFRPQPFTPATPQPFTPATPQPFTPATPQPFTLQPFRPNFRPPGQPFNIFPDAPRPPTTIVPRE